LPIKLQQLCTLPLPPEHPAMQKQDAQPLTFGHLIAASGSRIETMLWTIFVILLVLWLLGVVTSYTMGGFIHILLVIAIAVVLINVITGRRAI
jgi:hypothetical protein